MAKKRPFVIAAMVMIAFGLIALLNTASPTGYSVYSKLSSIFSGNTLSTISGPLVVLTLIFAVSIIGLKKISE